jgi:3',5'-cyclic AMP phosphodiesterase CpdA
VLIAQLSDTHVVRAGVRARLGRDPGEYLEEAIAFVNGLVPAPDVVLVTGDLVNRGGVEEYRRWLALIGKLAVPVYVVPGNHDRVRTLREIVPASYYPGANGGRLNYAIEQYPLRLVAVDSAQPGRAGGALDAATLAWLGAALAAEPDRPTLIFMHHPPFHTGVRFADILGFRNLRDFQAIVARHPAVVRIISGHIHCERRTRIGNAEASSAVSTALQFVPEFFERRPIWFRKELGGVTLHRWAAGTFTHTVYRNHDGRLLYMAWELSGNGNRKRI